MTPMAVTGARKRIYENGSEVGQEWSSMLTRLPKTPSIERVFGHSFCVFHAANFENAALSLQTRFSSLILVLPESERRVPAFKVLNGVLSKN